VQRTLIGLWNPVSMVHVVHVNHHVCVASRAPPRPHTYQETSVVGAQSCLLGPWSISYSCTCRPCIYSVV